MCVDESRKWRAVCGCPCPEVKRLLRPGIADGPETLAANMTKAGTAVADIGSERHWMPFNSRDERSKCV